LSSWRGSGRRDCDDDEAVAEPLAEDGLFLHSVGSDRTRRDHRSVDREKPTLARRLDADDPAGE
jgi:hypothetical protein